MSNDEEVTQAPTTVSPAQPLAASGPQFGSEQEKAAYEEFKAQKSANEKRAFETTSESTPTSTSDEDYDSLDNVAKTRQVIRDFLRHKFPADISLLDNAIKKHFGSE